MSSCRNAGALIVIDAIIKKKKKKSVLCWSVLLPRNCSLQKLGDTSVVLSAALCTGKFLTFSFPNKQRAWSRVDDLTPSLCFLICEIIQRSSIRLDKRAFVCSESAEFNRSKLSVAVQAPSVAQYARRAFPIGTVALWMFLGLKAVVPSHMISSSHVRTRKNTSMKLPTFLGKMWADKKGLVADAYQVEGLRGINLGVETIRERGAVEGKPQLQNSRDKGLHKTLKGNKTVSNFW